MNRIEKENINAALNLMLSIPWLLLILVTPILLQSLIYIFLFSIKSTKAPVLIVAIMSIPITPFVYGAYLEALRNNEFSFLMLLKKHLLNYFITIIIIGLPIALLAFLKMSLGGTYYFLEFVLKLIIGLATIYVLPLVFITGNIFKSIKEGVLYIISQYQVNYILLIVAAISFVLVSFSGWLGNIIFNKHFYLLIILSTIAACISILLSCLVFVAACARLKEISDNSDNDANEDVEQSTQPES